MRGKKINKVTSSFVSGHGVRNSDIFSVFFHIDLSSGLVKPRLLP